MNNPLISIIVPVYKAEKTIDNCIQSICDQTFVNWELILIDDGSPDNSGRICDKYAEKDNRIRCIHKQNGGVSSARNMGLDMAEGEFITFVDSDDYIGKDYLLLFANHKEYDLIFTGLHRFGAIDKEWFGEAEVIYPTIQALAEAWMSCFEETHITLGGLNFAACKALRAKYIKEHDLRFDSRMRKGEDTCFLYEWMKYGKNAIQVKGNEYYYYSPAGGHDFKMTLDEYQIHCIIYQQHIEEIHKHFNVFSQKQLDAYAVSTFNAYYNKFNNASIGFIREESKKFREQNKYPIFDAIKRENGAISAWIIKLSFYNPFFCFLYKRFKNAYYLTRKLLRTIITRVLRG